MNSTQEIIESLFSTFTPVITIESITDNGDGSWDIEVAEILNTRPKRYITISDTQYLVTAVNAITKVITITSGDPVVGTTYMAPTVFFFHGTPIATSIELNNIKDASLKLPMCYLFEIIRDRKFPDPLSSIDREVEVTLYFLDQADYQTWDTDHHYELAIMPMARFAEVFFKDYLFHHKQLAYMSDYEMTYYPKFDPQTSLNGVLKTVFSDQMSGVGVRVTFQIKKSRCGNSDVTVPFVIPSNESQVCEIIHDCIDPDLAELQAEIDASEASIEAHIADLDNPHEVTKSQIGLGNVDNTSDVNKPVSTAQAAADAAVLSAAEDYADTLVVGLLDDRGNYDASGNVFPSAGGSGAAGAILKGDLWTISVAGTLGGVQVTAGDVVRALADTPGQTASNWAVTENNFGYVAENSANKDTDGTLAANSDIKYPSQKAVKTYVDGRYTGTANRISVSIAGQIDIDANYVGQTSITTVGTIGTGTWQGTSISTTYTDAKIKGTISANQIGYGSAADTLAGSANLTYDGTILLLTSDSGTFKFRSLVGSTSIPAIYGNQTTPSATNFGIAIGTGFTYINSTSLIQLGINGAEIGRFSGSSVFSLGSSGGAGSINLGGVNNTTPRKLNIYQNINSSACGISIENNTNGTAANANINFHNESSNHQSSINRTASAVTGNFTGTTIARSNVFYIGNTHAAATSSVFGFNSTSIFSLMGTATTNYGHTLSAVGFRVDQIQNLHTANLNPFTVNGNSYLGGNVTATAKVHIGAGSASASTAPLKFTSGALMTAPEAGAVEFLTDKYYATITSGAARKEFIMGDNAITDAVNIVFGTSTGSKIGTATSEKIGFWNATPIVQPASANQAALTLDTDVTGADTVDKSAVDSNFTALQTLVNQLRADLVATGLIKGEA